MTKLALLSDIHLSSQTPVCRKDDLREVQWLKLKWVYDRAHDAGCTAVVVAGDFVDVACSWALLPELAKFLREQSSRISTLTVFGQHDTYMYDANGRRKTIIGALAEAGLIRVLSELPVVIGDSFSCYLYGASYGQSLPEHPSAFGGKSMLVLHAPISDQELWAGQNYLDARRFLAEHQSFSTILCGDIHREFLVKVSQRTLLNTGPLLRRKADEAAHEPNFRIFDFESNRLERVVVPHAAGEDIISREHIERERAYDRLIGSMETPQQAGNLDSSTEIKFSDTLNEVAAANQPKITPGVVRLLSEITGVTIKETKRAEPKQKAAAKAGRSSSAGNDRTQPKGQSKGAQRAAGKAAGRSKS